MAEIITKDERLKRLKEANDDLDEILEDNTGKKLIYHAERIADLLGKKINKNDFRRDMSTSQIRKLFSEVKKMKYDPYKISLLKAKLAYTAGRHDEVRDLQEVLDMALDKINGEKTFDRFKDFFEAIVAYHRKFGKE
jgi:CRISPR-associated protein Csm2